VPHAIEGSIGRGQQIATVSRTVVHPEKVLTRWGLKARSPHLDHQVRGELKGAAAERASPLHGAVRARHGESQALANLQGVVGRPGEAHPVGLGLPRLRQVEEVGRPWSTDE